MKHIYFFSGGVCVGRAVIVAQAETNYIAFPDSSGTPYFRQGKIWWFGDFLVTGDPVSNYNTAPMVLEEDDPEAH